MVFGRSFRSRIFPRFGEMVAALLVLFFMVGPTEPGWGRPGANEIQETDRLVKADKPWVRLPLSFEVNRGQTDERVRFLARGPGSTLFLTPQEAVLLRQKLPNESDLARAGGDGSPLNALNSVVRLRFSGANPRPEIIGQEPRPGRVNYFIGPKEKWRTHLPTYTKVRYREVYPGIDLVFYGHQRLFEYDFVVSPGADPSLIRLVFDGADKIHVDGQGRLILETALGPVIQPPPLVYQEIDGRRKIISARNVLSGNNQVEFRIGSYDPGRPLFIDPIFASTFLGGSGNDDVGRMSFHNSESYFYLVGQTASPDFPTTAGVYQTGLAGSLDVFIAKFNSDLTTLQAATYLGGTSNDNGKAGFLDSSDYIYVTGNTMSTDFPTTAGAYDQTHNGSWDVFVSKLSPALDTLFASTYLGGGSLDVPEGLVLDGSGYPIVVGYTASTDYPTSGGYDNTYNGGSSDVFVSMLAPDLSGLAYSTYLGGSAADDGYAVAVDVTGAVFAAGRTSSTNFPTAGTVYDTTHNGSYDVFLSKFTANLGTLTASTFLGGGGYDEAYALRPDGGGSYIYVAGQTSSTDFPTTGGVIGPSHQAAFDGFISKFPLSLGALTASTYLNGDDMDQVRAMGEDDGNNVYLVGYTNSSDFPVLPDSYQRVNAGGYDVFISRLNNTFTSLLASTYLGGSGDDYGYSVYVKSSGDIFVSGSTFSADFPMTPGEYYDQSLNGGSDIFVSIFDTGLSDDDPPEVTGTNPADGATGVATNSLISATFNETMNPATVTTSLTVDQGVTGAVNYDANTLTATLTPSAALAPNTTYTAKVLAGVEDTAGIPMISDYVWTFTTQAGADNTPPTVTGTDPADGAAGVAVDTVVSAVFSESMDPVYINTQTFTLMNMSAADGGGAAVQGTVSYTDSSRTAAFRPAAELSPGTNYRATITAGVRDLAGNNLAENHVWNFTTASQPPAAASRTSGLPAGTDAAAYRMVSVPLDPATPTPEAVFGAQIGTYDPTLMRIGRWNPAGGHYDEYPFSGDIRPGWTGWFLFRHGKTLTFQGHPTPTTYNLGGVNGYALDIVQGWNQVGNPYGHRVNVGDFMVEDGDGSHEHLTGSANNITQRVFWIYADGQYRSGSVLEISEGGWLKKLTPGGGHLFFPPIEAAADSSAAPPAVRDDLERPPDPPGGLDSNPSPSGGGGEGGGGGCFIGTVGAF